MNHQKPFRFLVARITHRVFAVGCKLRRIPRFQHEDAFADRHFNLADLHDDVFLR